MFCSKSSSLVVQEVILFQHCLNPRDSMVQHRWLRSAPLRAGLLNRKSAQMHRQVHLGSQICRGRSELLPALQEPNQDQCAMPCQQDQSQVCVCQGWSLVVCICRVWRQAVCNSIVENQAMQIHFTYHISPNQRLGFFFNHHHHLFSCPWLRGSSITYPPPMFSIIP